MRLGIDLGTTRTVVAAADRGNYPIATFEDAQGDSFEHFPSVIADSGAGLCFGFEALAVARAGGASMRSFKRLLASPGVNANQSVRVGSVETSLLELMTGFASALQTELRARSNLAVSLGERPLQAVVAVPAHAHAAQRFLTMEAFRRAGIDVIALLNEPSAAGFEFTHRLARTISTRRSRVVVYDLGGGTFDASLVSVDGDHHDVLGTAGHPLLGGDDFDEVLATCVLRAAGKRWGDLDEKEREELLSVCRETKEGIGPNTRRITLDRPFVAAVTVEEYFEAAQPLVDKTVAVMSPLLGRLSEGDENAALVDIAGIYLVGGGSGLPLVSRALKARFGRRVHRSPYPGASTAIGLAIAADEQGAFTLTDRYSRAFGVFREQEEGKRLSFDALVTADAVLPTTSSDAQLVVARRYRAAHNIGHFRFVECPRLDEAGEPIGALLPFGDVRFPFDPKLRTQESLVDVPVERSSQGPIVEERYLVDAAGLVQVEIADLDTGFTRRYPLGVG
ncbi:MAG: Hsp70 family protein [Myxococcota bacterium]